MRILHSIATLHPSYGGPVQGVRSISEALIHFGHEVEIVTLDPPTAEWLEGWRAKVVGLGPSMHYYRFNARYLQWLRVNASRFDAVIANGLWRFSTLAVWLALRRSRTPFFVYPHGMLDPSFRQFRWKEIKKAVSWFFLDHRIVESAKAVLFTTEEEMIRARDRYRPYRIAEGVVRYGISDPPSDNPEMKAQLFNRHPELIGKRILLFLGRLHEIKGCDVLLHAFAQVRGREPSTHLIFVGPDECGLGESLASLADNLAIRKDVSFLGPMYGEDKWATYRCAYGFVLPSHGENFCVSMAEALSCGLPVVVSDKVGTSPYVASFKAGIIGGDDIASFSQALNRFLSLPRTEWEAMSRNARACFREHFHNYAAAEALLTMFGKCGLLRH